MTEHMNAAYNLEDRISTCGLTIYIYKLKPNSHNLSNYKFITLKQLTMDKDIALLITELLACITLYISLTIGRIDLISRITYL